MLLDINERRNKMKIKTAAALAVFATGMAANAEPPPGGREAFLRQQSYEQMQRVSGQVDVLESNQNALAERVSRLERGGGEVAALKAEIDALRAELARLRSDMQNQRREIVSDIVKKIPKPEPAPRPVADPTPSHSGPREEYVVQPGDTLSLISQAFGTTVKNIKEMNGLKSDALRVGQRLVVPGQASKRR